MRISTSGDLVQGKGVKSYKEKEGEKREKKKKLIPLDIIRNHFNIKSTSKKLKRSRVSFLWFSKI